MSRPQVVDLKNTKWKIKSDAIFYYKNLSSIKEVTLFYKEVIRLNDEIISGYYVRFSEDYLKSDDGIFISTVVENLIKLSSFSKSNKKLIWRIVKSYFGDPKNIRYVKILSLQNCFMKSQGEGRLLLTKIIGTNKFIELVPQVLRNFRLLDEEILYFSIQVFVNFNDKRANPFIRGFLKSKNANLRKAAILALGKIGGIIDYYPLWKELKKRDELALDILSSLCKILPITSSALIKFVHNNFDNKTIHNPRFFRITADFPYSKNIDFLIFSFLNLENEKIVFIIEMYLRELNQKVVLTRLISSYEQLDARLKLRLLQYLSESSSKDILPFLKREFLSEEEIVIKTMLLEILRDYSDRDVFLFMLDNLKKEYSPLSYYYVSYLLKYNMKDLEENLELIFSTIEGYNNELLYEVALSDIMTRSELFRNKQAIMSFVQNALVNSNQRIQYLALKALGKLGNIEYFDHLRVLVDKSDTKGVLFEQASISLWKIIQNNPKIVINDKDIINHPAMLKYIKPDKIKSDLIETVFSIVNLTEEDGNYYFLDRFFHRVFEDDRLLEAISKQEAGLSILLHFSIKHKYLIPSKMWKKIDYYIAQSSDYNILANYYRLMSLNNRTLSIEDFHRVSQLHSWGYGVTSVFSNIIGELR
ncbi:MAG: HEAT repeat domain-containing protein [Oligoflexia bacterium]|nr:HEAT repeat domain-containing protein [Oligoflexia bacterium]